MKIALGLDDYSPLTDYIQSTFGGFPLASAFAILESRVTIFVEKHPRRDEDS